MIPRGRKTAADALKAKPPMAVIVAVKQDEVALNTAIRFRKLLDEMSLFAIPVFVRIRTQHRRRATSCRT